MDVESTFPPAPPPSFSSRFKCQKGRIFDATSACQSACRSSEDILSAAGALTTSKTHTLFYIFSLSQYHYIHAILLFSLVFSQPTLLDILFSRLQVYASSIHIYILLLMYFSLRRPPCLPRCPPCLPNPSLTDYLFHSFGTVFR